jgi:hypothetical protein
MFRGSCELLPISGTNVGFVFFSWGGGSLSIP